MIFPDFLPDPIPIIALPCHPVTHTVTNVVETWLTWPWRMKRHWWFHGKVAFVVDAFALGNAFIKGENPERQSIEKQNSSHQAVQGEFLNQTNHEYAPLPSRGQSNHQVSSPGWRWSQWAQDCFHRPSQSQKRPYHHRQSIRRRTWSKGVLGKVKENLK